MRGGGCQRKKGKGKDLSFFFRVLKEEKKMEKKKLTKPCMSETQIHCSATSAASPPLLLLFPSEEEADGTGDGGAEEEEGKAPLPPSLPASDAELVPLLLSL